jgi:hypothetical protein
MPDPTQDYLAALARVREAVKEVKIADQFPWNAPGVGARESELGSLWCDIDLLLTPGPEMTREDVKACLAGLISDWIDEHSLALGSTAWLDLSNQLAVFVLHHRFSAALSERLKWAERIAELEREVEHWKAVVRQWEVSEALQSGDLNV